MTAWIYLDPLVNLNVPITSAMGLRSWPLDKWGALHHSEVRARLLSAKTQLSSCLTPVPLRCYRVKGHTLQRQVAGVTPLMECVGWHQHCISFGDRILFPVTEQGAMPFQDIDYVLPGMRVAAAVRVADGAWSH